MDFGDILNEWDKIKKDRDSVPVSDRMKDEGEVEDRGAESRRLADLKPQAVLDLHGMFAEDAESAIGRFIEVAVREGLEKVLIIHGKGLHSEGGVSVLKKTARMAVEANPLAGRFGEAARSEGGAGALWVILRKRRSST